MKTSLPAVIVVSLAMSSSWFLLLGMARLSAQDGNPKDFKNVPLKDLGIELVAPRKDAKTGFVTGGRNSTVLIEGLTEINGRTIAELEKTMRPGAESEAGSDAGFLGQDEKLLEVLADDNRYVVEKLGLTHQELAKHLRIMGALALKEKGEILYHGQRFKVDAIPSRGFQLSPFHDGTKTNVDVTIRNASNGKTLKYSLLVPDMMERYGFYEGKGTPYRVDPREILNVFDFLKKDAKTFDPHPN